MSNKENTAFLSKTEENIQPIGSNHFNKLPKSAIMEGVKTRAKLFLIAPMLLASLSACGSGEQGSHTGTAEDFVTVNFYTDYVGIDYSNPDASQATYLGKCYLLKSDAKDVRASLGDVEKVDGDPIDYKTSARTPEEGHHYTFDGWAGVYASGGEIDPKNVRHDVDSCNLFAHFDYEINVYTCKVTVQGEAKSFQVEHGTKFKEFYPEYASASYVGSEYYKDYTLDGYTVSINSVETVYSISDAAELEVTSNTTFTAKFAEQVASYNVTIKNEAGDTLSTVPVEYDQALSYLPEAPTGYAFDRYEGTYATGESVPRAVAGKPVDTKHIRFDCTLTAYFAKDKINVIFRNEDDTANLAVFSIPEGASVNAPSFTASAGNVFTGDWYTSLSDLSLAPFDCTAVNESVTLYPRVLPKEVNYADGGNTFLYRYDHSFHGYGLRDFDTTSPSVSLGANSFFGPSTFADPRYGFVSVCDLDEDNDGAQRKIASLTLPTSTKAIYADSLMALDITSLDLTACTSLTDIQFHAFRRCLSLLSLSLPGSLQNVGSKIAEGNTALTSFSIAMSEAEKNGRNFDSLWDFVSTDWNASHSVTFA